MTKCTKWPFGQNTQISLFVITVICSLEGSGKWPDDYEAMRRLKAAFHIQLGDAMKTNYDLPVRIGTTFVDILKVHRSASSLENLFDAL